MAHSLSPGMHEIIYSILGLDWVYIKKEISPDKLEDFIESIKIDKKIRGFNLTIPHKEAVISLLDEVDEQALQIGAVNTVLKTDAGLKGFNTDWMGFLSDITALLGGPPANKTTLLIGCGGAGLSVLEALSYSNFSTGGESDVYLYDIDRNKAEMVASISRMNLNLHPINKEDLEETLSQADLLVNASPLGMKEGDFFPLKISPSNMKAGLSVYDLVYNRKTELLKNAEELNLKALGGLGMLAGQGLEAFKIWYGKNLEESKLLSIKTAMVEYLKKEVGRDD